VLGVIRAGQGDRSLEVLRCRHQHGQVGAMIEDVSTLAELREYLLEAEGRAVVNGRPYVDGAEVLCFPCRRGIEETGEVVWDERREGLLWDVTVSHIECEGGTQR